MAQFTRIPLIGLYSNKILLNINEEGMEDPRRTGPTESTKERAYGITETEAASMGCFWLLA